MAWTVSLNVDIGAYTKASDYDKLAANAEYLQTLAAVSHDFNVSTGTGYHNGLFSAPTIFKASASIFMSLWLDDTDPTNIAPRIMTGVSAVAVTPGSKALGVMLGLGGIV